jgi:hypothetical protein
MSRGRLRRALATRSTKDGALVPLVEAHAARLEQLPEDRWLADAEAQARMLRAVQALYGLDAVTIGGSGLLASTACWLARAPALGVARARDSARTGRPLDSRSQPQVVAEAASIALARDVLARLKPVLGERAGVAVVLPDPARLARQLGVPREIAWATDVVAELVRSIGPDEPDLFLLLGDDDHVEPTLETLAEFFGAALVPLGAAAPAGVVTLEVENLLAECEPPAGWLYATATEIPEGADPGAMRAAFERLGRRATP